MDSVRRAVLERVLLVSTELLGVAENGDVQSTATLDAERLLLLDSIRDRPLHFDPEERSLLRQINELNDRAIGFLEHRRRIKLREIETATLGRRATVAYAATRPDFIARP